MALIVQVIVQVGLIEKCEKCVFWGMWESLPISQVHLEFRMEDEGCAGKNSETSAQSIRA